MSCFRPRIAADPGSILAFDDLDKRCASHFLSRQVAQRGRQRCLRLLGKCDGKNEIYDGGSIVSVDLNRRNAVYSNMKGADDEESRDERDEADVLRIKAEGWAVLADSQVSLKNINNEIKRNKEVN